ncbi:uncharacterized protein LOC106656558 [Trichogramma pretiosum]|uniref:uncharacterized protein LOC106656558 n=1 Tax=Trichogramma pretiosum TaxID=7493 RepID=UPI0006C96F48|nr:uncharacterized protein LOC106656558 [Trichogramma pretiosum]
MDLLDDSDGAIYAMDQDNFIDTKDYPADEDDRQVRFILDFDKFFKIQDDICCIAGKSTVSSDQFLAQADSAYDLCEHNDEYHQYMLELYNQSIAFAEKNLELGTAYFRKSQLLLHLKKFKDCMIELAKAEKLAKSENDQLKENIESTKQTCIASMEKGNNDSVEEQSTKLHDLLPKEIPYKSNKIDVEVDRDYGRYLLTNSTIEASELIAIEESVVAYPRCDFTYLVCSYCLKCAWNAVPCDTCPYVIYCSDECKKLAWEQFHDEECPVYPYMYCERHYDLDKTYILMALRLFIMFVKKHGVDEIMEKAKIIDSKREVTGENFLSTQAVVDCKNVFDFDCIYNLPCMERFSNGGDLSKYVIESMAVNALYRYSSILKDEDLNAEGNNYFLIDIKIILVHLSRILQTNANEYQGSTVLPENHPEECDKRLCNKCNILPTACRGLILTPFCSLLNNDCTHNVSKVFMPERRVMMFATNFIQAKQKLCENNTSLINKLRGLEVSKQIVTLNKKFISCKECTKSKSSDTEYKISEELKNQIFEDCSPEVLNIMENDHTKWVYSQDILKQVIQVMKISFKLLKEDEYYYFLKPYRDYINRIVNLFFNEDISIPKCN